MAYIWNTRRSEDKDICLVSTNIIQLQNPCQTFEEKLQRGNIKDIRCTWLYSHYIYRSIIYLWIVTAYFTVTMCERCNVDDPWRDRAVFQKWQKKFGQREWTNIVCSHHPDKDVDKQRTHGKKYQIHSPMHELNLWQVKHQCIPFDAQSDETWLTCHNLPWLVD